ncbi:MAG TPA: carotenoid biosynthesis protein [Gemmatimonadales bacterium]|nr:carotenoid biosynthesis protein [Gemmatimonadales bacterium]
MPSLRSLLTTGSTWRRLAVWCALAYAVLTVMSIGAFHFMVGKPVPEGFDAGMWAAGYAFGMKYFGALIIYVGFGAAMFGLADVVGLRRGVLGSAVVVAMTLAVELVGAKTGFPFGDHGYGGQLGWLVMGLVPFVIPLSWFLMLYASLGIALRFRRGPLATLALSALGLFAWDVLMEPAMSAAYPFWMWRSTGVYYGMPLANWLSWLVIGPVIALALRWVAGPDLRRLADDPLPPVVYVLTGILPLALALEYRLWPAAAIGGGAMLLYLVAPRIGDAIRGIRPTAAPSRLTP